MNLMPLALIRSGGRFDYVVGRPFLVPLLSKITQMKDGRTHLAHKAEHAVDLETGAIVGITVQHADEGDTTTIQETLPDAAKQLEAVAAVTDDAVAVIKEVVADKGYHSRTTMRDLEALEIRTYISEPDRGPQSWIDREAERDAVYANRRRIRGNRGQRLLRRRGELIERPCAHLYETGGLPRAHVRGHENVRKRLLVQASAFNLGLGCGRCSALARHAVSRAAWLRSIPCSADAGASHTTRSL
jgi:DDE family transposase